MNPPERIARKIIDGIGEQLDKSDLYDVTVSADGTDFKCHRVILAAVSGFFNALLSSGMKEAIEKSITLQDISQQTFSEILECVYKGKYILNTDNILEVWHAANLLQILFLVGECEMFVKETLSVTNCLAMYQHSKLLGSREIRSLAWDFIELHFDQVRLSDEILLLTAGEMKKLVSSQNLKTISEDFVVETIFRWVSYGDEQETNKTCTHYSSAEAEVKHEPAMECKVDASNQHLAVDSQAPELHENKQDNPSKISGQQNQQHKNGCDVGSCGLQSKANAPTSEDENYSESCPGKGRVEYFPDLLGAARLCLASGKCLMEIKSSRLGQGNKAVQEIVELGMRYQIQPDRRHDYIPAGAIQRSSSPYEMLLVSGNKRFDTAFLVGMNITGEWFGFDCSLSNGYNFQKAKSFDDSIICLVSNYNLCMFRSLKPNNNWKNLPQFKLGNSPVVIVDFFVEGNLLYAIFQKDEYFIATLDMKNLDSEWVRVGCLSNYFGSVKCSVVVGDSVAIFREIIDNTTRIAVECFSTKTLRTCHVLDVDGPSTCVVTFKKNDEGFALLGNGSLYRVTPGLSAPPMVVKYETLLWDFDRELCGAVICNDELLLLGTQFPTHDQDKKWELPVPGAFKSIRNIRCSTHYYTSLIPMIFYKRGLTKKIFI